MVRSIYHVRHGETDWNVAGRLQGRQDIPLNASGRAQAEANGAAFAAHLAAIGRAPDEFSWIGSPLGRARETMERIRRAVGLPVEGYTIEPDLREVSFGIYEGWTYEDLAARVPADFAALMGDKWNFCPPEGESYEMLAERVATAIDRTSGDLVIVSHGGVFRALKVVIEESGDHEVAHLNVPQDRIHLWRDRIPTWL